MLDPYNSEKKKDNSVFIFYSKNQLCKNLQIASKMISKTQIKQMSIYLSN